MEIKGAIKAKRKHDIIVEDILFTDVSWTMDCEILKGQNINYFIYSAKAEKGAYSYFLFTKKKLQHIGDVRLALKMLTIKEAFDKYEVQNQTVKAISKKLQFTEMINRHMDSEKTKSGQQISFREAFEHIYSELSISDDGQIRPIFFDIIDPIEAIDFSKIDIDELTKVFLTENYDVDQRLLAAFNGLIPRFSFRKDNARKIQQSTPHMIIATNPKTGKSTMSDKVGIRYDSVRTSRLLGFSDSNEIHRGDLDGKNEPFIADEIQEEEKQNIFAQLLSYLEIGRSQIGKGKQTINTYGVSPLVFIANPRVNANRLTTSEDLLQAFDLFLQKITDNYRAFGSRIGLVLFGTNYAEASVQDSELILDDTEIELVSDTIYYILEKYADKLTDIYLDPKIRIWTQKPLSEQYISEASKITQSINDETESVRSFWQGHFSAFRHIRGLAVRMAIVKSLKEIIEDKIDIDEVIELAEISFNEVCNMNLRSMESMSKTKINPDYKAKLIESIKNKKKIYLLYNVIEIKSQELDMNDFISTRRILTFDELKDIYNSITTIEESGAGYEYISQIVSKLSKSDEINLKYIGVEVVKDNKKPVGIRFMPNFIK